jgi:curved DNA-binding protein CbpA
VYSSGIITLVLPHPPTDMNLLSKSTLKVFTLAPYRKRSFSFQARRSVSFGSGEIGGGADAPLGRTSRLDLQNLSPYEVLGIDCHAPYTRQHFTELAKRYHPDCASHSSNAIEDAASRLDRFHIVMDAHHILSDPRRREVYDLYGLGWKHLSPSQTNGLQGTDTYARMHEDSPGTDWWKEHEEYSKNKEEVFLRKVIGAVALLIFIALTSWLQLRRAATILCAATRGYMQTHEMLVSELVVLRAEGAKLSKDDRIKKFVLQREAHAAGRSYQAIN